MPNFAKLDELPTLEAFGPDSFWLFPKLQSIPKVVAVLLTSFLNLSECPGFLPKPVVRITHRPHCGDISMT